MQANGLYEASGLVLWLRTGVYSTGSSRDVNPGDVAFSALRKFEADHFSKDAALNTYVCRGPKKQRSQKPRLIWPITMVCGIEASSAVETQTCFDSSLNTAACHFVIWSWYLAVFHALQKNDSQLCIFSFSCKLPHQCPQICFGLCSFQTLRFGQTELRTKSGLIYCGKLPGLSPSRSDSVRAKRIGPWPGTMHQNA